MARKSNPILDNLQTVHGRMQDLPRGPNFCDSERVACRETSCGAGVAMRVLGGGGGGGGWFRYVGIH